MADIMDKYGDRMHLVEEDGKRYAVIEIEQERFIENGDPRPMYVEVPMGEEMIEAGGQLIGIPRSRGVEVIAQGYEEAVEKAERAAQAGEGRSLREDMRGWLEEQGIDMDDLDEIEDEYGN